jgi:hypothetical protein
MTVPGELDFWEKIGFRQTTRIMFAYLNRRRHRLNTMGKMFSSQGELHKLPYYWNGMY